MLSRRLWPAALLICLLSAACSEGPTTALQPAPTPDPVPDVIPEPVSCDEAGPFVSTSPVRLLTRFEYDNSVRDLTGDDARAAAAFPPENRVNAFDNNARAHVVSPLLIQKYMEASEDLADRVIPDRMSEIVPCDPAEVGESRCGATFISGFASRAFRRPITSGERTIFVDLFEETLAEKGFEEGVKLVVQAVLQSPQFLYRLELQEGGEPDLDTVHKIEGYAMASRLSYFLWSSMPDDALFEAAAAGELSTPAQLEAQTQRMMNDEKASATIRSFHRQWLGMAVLESLTKDLATYPQYTDEIRDDWLVSLEAFVDHLYFDGEPTVEGLLSDPTVFLTPELAELHGVEVPGPIELMPWEAPEGQRAGILTQPALMAVLANPDQSSPILRGIFVRERLLCQELPPPPADQEINPPDPAPGATTRERFAEHTNNDDCAGCHVLIDPIGFGFERYDGIGRWRDMDNGLPIDDSGELTNVGTDPAEGPFNGAVELANKMSESEIVQDCVAEQWFTYANGRLPEGYDECALEVLQETFREEGGDLRGLLVAIVLSDAFRHRVAQGQQEAP